MRRIPLVCIPFAGAGASFFRTWPSLAGERLRIVAIQPPGREWRLGEAPYRDVVSAADGLVPDVLEQVGDATEVALFGHSLGAVVAYELACRLADRPGVDVRRLVVSGSPGPWTGRASRATGLADDEFLLRVEEFAGYSHEALADPEMRELMLPILRADVQMHESYVAAADQPLPVPVTAVRGRDDELVSAEQAREWSKATSRDFRLAEVVGGHMYLATSVGELLRLIEDDLTCD